MSRRKPSRAIAHAFSAFVLSLLTGLSPAADRLDLPAHEGWREQIQEKIRLEEYRATPILLRDRNASDDTVKAVNSAHRFTATFGGAAVVLRPHGSDGVRWEWGLSLEAWGRAGRLRSPGVAALSAKDNRVELSREQLTEWYVNSPEGLEHGFTIPAAPDRDGAGLVIDTKLRGNLVPKFAPDAQSIDFYDGGNVSVLRYAQLVVTDVSGKRLPSRFQPIPGGIRIVVDDEQGIYPLSIDLVASSPAWTGSGDENGARFGQCVATAGDVNGDGYSDVVVGASSHDAGAGAGADRGRAYLFLGAAAGLVTSPAWTVSGDENSSQFGWSVAAAGDVNGDGFADVIVGAYMHDAGGGAAANRGRTYLYLGGAGGPATTPSWTASGDDNNGAFGYSVATAGDVNGDGYADVLVGAYTHDAGGGAGADRGRAYLYLGGAGGLATSAASTISGDENNALVGGSVASAGDVNGDGYSDVIVGAWAHDAGAGAAANRGRAYVYLGGAGGLAPTPTWTGSGDETGAFYGECVSSAGDVDGDGYADVLVSAYQHDAGGGANANRGRAYLYMGSASGPATSPAWTHSGDENSAFFGQSLATAGDTNGDGYSDVIVGANWQGDRGRADLFLGSGVGLTANPAWNVFENENASGFGHSVATAGDANGDGFSDVVIGAYVHDADAGAAANRGRAWLYLGSGGIPTGAPSWTASGDENSSDFGRSVATAGDVNADGYSDVIVGAHMHDAGGGAGADRGRAYVYLGSLGGLATTPAWTGSGAANNDHYGFAVATAGDVNGDGYSDVIVTSLSSTIQAAFLYLGSASGLATSAAWTGHEGDSTSGYGYAAATAGDVNGDGFADVIVGAPFHSAGGTNSGRAYLYLGSPSGLALTPAWTVTGDEANANYGFSVATAGDVNGDGYSDIVVGAYSHDGGAGAAADRGRAYLYLGGATGLSTTPAWTATGDQNGALLGYRLATAGDVNGDGFADVAIGALLHDAGGNDLGRAYVYLGSGSGLGASPSWTASGTENFGDFSMSAATAGDVNGDGYSDVFVGAPRNNGTGFDRGLGFLYLGSALGLAPTFTWAVQGDQDGAQFGFSAASSGDVNGDGFADIVVVALRHPAGGTNRGRAYGYYGNGGDGLHRLSRQARTDSVTPIALGGKSDSETAYRVRARGVTPAGRGKVRLEWESKPLGTPFDGTGVGSSSLQDTGTPTGSGSAATFNEAVATGEGRSYHWRLRVVSPDLFFPRSPWISMAGNNVTESKLRTSGCVDRDGDGAGDFSDPSCSFVTADCNPLDPNAWDTPGETVNQRFTSKTSLAWDPPPAPGAPPAALLYDTLRSGLASGFALGVCVESDDGPNTAATDPVSPSVGQGYFYLTRAQNACPQGVGSLGASSSGAQRLGLACP